MLITCSECGSEISSKALSCPKCGCPVHESKPMKKSSKRMKLPNGFGRITKLAGQNLRKPYRAMVTVGKDESGRPIGKLLKPVSYFSTYNEAYKALMEYNKSPYDYSNTITMQELYEKWYEKKSEKVSASRLKQIRAAWKYCSALYEVEVQNIRTKILKETIENSDAPSDVVKKHMKEVLSGMLDYAVEYEIVSHNYMRDIKSISSDSEAKNPHILFTEEETKTIKENLNDPIMQLIYVECYTGLRPSELCSIELSKMNTTEWYILCGMKTKAGTNRKVPIHPAIQSLIKNHYTKAIKNGQTYLFPLTYDMYVYDFKKAMKKYNMNGDHRPHDCRKHFITMAKKAGMDEYAIKLIVGHVIQDITESVYTQRDIKWLHKELRKLP